MPSMRQINDDIQDFITCMQRNRAQTIVEQVLKDNSINTAKQIALWIDSKEYIRKQIKKDSAND